MTTRILFELCLLLVLFVVVVIIVFVVVYDPGFFGSGFFRSDKNTYLYCKGQRQEIFDPFLGRNFLLI